MRNITVWAVLVIMGGSIPGIAAQERETRHQTGQLQDSYAVSLSYQAGFWYGQTQEIVYPSDTKARLLSQLVWDIKPVWYNGLLLDFSQIEPAEKWGYYAALSLKYGVNGNSGILENRDWMSEENSGLTHFSRHDTYTREFTQVDTAAGINIPLQSFRLKTAAHVTYMRMRFSGIDGYGIYARSLANGQYAAIDDNPDTITFSGKVINYSQEWLIIAPGIALEYHIDTRFSAALSFLITPFIWCAALDEHLTRRVQFSDYPQGGLFFEPGVSLSFSPARRLSFSIDCSGRFTGEVKGMSYQRSYGTQYSVQNGEAGARLSIIDTAARLNIRL